MAGTNTLTGKLANLFADVIHDVDESIGENRDYGAGIGPHDEDDQVDALARETWAQFDASIATAKSDPGVVSYPAGQSPDIVIDSGDRTEFCEAKLLRFQKANGNPSAQGYSKVFSPFQNHSPRSFVHDVAKLAEADIRAAKTLLGIYYRPVDGAGVDITADDIAEKFASDATQWTGHNISVDTVAPFSGLQHEVHRRGAVIVWALEDQPKKYF